MLTAKQYEAVGRLALHFNEVEYLFEVYMAHLLATPEWSVAVLFAEEGGGFARKAERFARVLNAIRKERPHLDFWIDGVIKLVERAKTLADGRNRYVHGLVIEDVAKNETRLRIRGKEMEFDFQEIVNLVNETAVLVNEFHNHLGDLIALLESAREGA